MAEKKTKFEYAGRIGADQAAAYLEAMAAGLREQRLRLASGGQSIMLHPAETLRAELEAAFNPEKGKGSLQFELSWRVEEAEAAGDLLISSEEEPEPEGGAEDEDEEPMMTEPITNPEGEELVIDRGF
ncbi:MAG TPA: amphi-Trp domain-containing protein [Dehalococcoidia bacterium]|nr:amphi-Trp domain-containing protein [Dehalococcoidia bacterium]